MATEDTPRLAGQAALVTGASSGLGRATAVALARAGADVALLARSEGDLRRVAEEISGTTSRRALPLPLDLADEASLLAAVDRAATAFGRVDVLVNAAGTDAPGSAEELAIPAWDRVLAVNLRAPFVLAKAVFPHMRRVGRGTIVNVSSLEVRADRPDPGPRRGGPTPRYPRLRPLPGRDGDPVGRMVAGGARGRGARVATAHQGAAAGPGGGADRLDRECSTRARAQRGGRQPPGRGRLAVAAEWRAAQREDLSGPVPRLRHD